jgi:hypothetical protein
MRQNLAAIADRSLGRNGPAIGDVGAGMTTRRANPRLPPAGTMTWGKQRKAAVVKAIRAGAITRDEACAYYILSPEELAAWELGFDRAGATGLSAKGALRGREHDRRLAQSSQAG